MYCVSHHAAVSSCLAYGTAAPCSVAPSSICAMHPEKRYCTFSLHATPFFCTTVHQAQPEEDSSCAAVMCMAPSTCHKGHCISVKPPQDPCDGVYCIALAGVGCCKGGCVNMLTDAKNCGGCGRTCPSFLGCNQGKCGMPAKALIV